MNGSRSSHRRRAGVAFLLCGVLLGAMFVADGVSSRANATGTPVVNVGDVTVSEGNAGFANVVMPIELSQPASAIVSVKWALVGVSATAGSDFRAAHGTAIFAIGQTSRKITVRVYGDTNVEPDETVSVTLSTPVGVTLGRNGTLTIRNDDVAVGAGRVHASVATPEVAVGSATVVEGDAGTHYLYLPVTLSEPPTQTVRVTVATECGSALANVDYIAPSVSQLLFARNQQSKELTFRILTNTTPQDVAYFLEHIILTVGGVQVGVSTGTAEILGNGGAAGANARQSVAPADTSTIQRASLAPDGSELFFNDSSGCGNHVNVIGSKFPMVSDDGTKVAFYSDAINAVPGVTDGALHVYVRDLTAGTTERVDLAPGPSAGFGALGMSADGRYVTYSNDSPLRIYRYDRATHTTVLVSVLPSGAATHNAYRAAISADGSKVAFLDEPATNIANLYIRDVAAGTTQFIAKADGSWANPALSGDGRYVAFESADALIPSDTNNYPDIYVDDTTTGALEIVNVTTGGAQEAPNPIWPTLNPTGFSISRDGRYVAFTSWSHTFATHTADVLVRDRVAQTTTSVTGSFVHPPGKATCVMGAPALSDGAARVAFLAHCQDTSGVPAVDDLTGVFVADAATGAFTRLDTDAGGAPSNADPSYGGEPPAITPDGSVVAFDSIGSNLVDSDTNSEFDVFLRTLG
jgi:Tol biopolymer transport system component